MNRAANGPSMDPAVTPLMRYTTPLALLAGVAALAFVGWLLAQ